MDVGIGNRVPQPLRSNSMRKVLFPASAFLLLIGDEYSDDEERSGELRNYVDQQQ